MMTMMTMMMMRRRMRTRTRMKRRRRRSTTTTTTTTTHYTKLHYELTIPAPETCTADFTTSSLSLNSVAAYLSHIIHICITAKE